MWYSASRPRGLRGFSCWIAPKKQGTATPANAKLFLDGIDMTGTTDIEDIFGGEEGKKVEKFANGIYNINGQLVRANGDSTEGLPEGLYIINGKKTPCKALIILIPINTYPAQWKANSGFERVGNGKQ